MRKQLQRIQEIQENAQKKKNTKTKEIVFHVLLLSVHMKDLKLLGLVLFLREHIAVHFRYRPETTKQKTNLSCVLPSICAVFGLRTIFFV